MCDPATLTIAAAVVSAAGTGYSAMQQASQHRYQAAVATRNASLSAQAANQEQENTRQAALDHYRRVAQLKGSQRAQMAANGIDVNFGNAAEIQADTEMMSREDAQRIYTQGFRNTQARDFETSNYFGEANAQRKAATGALIGGAFEIAGTALSTASQFGKVKGKLPKSASSFGSPPGIDRRTMEAY